MSHPAHPTRAEIRYDLDMQMKSLATKASDLHADIERVADAVRDDYGQGSKHVTRDLDAAAKLADEAYDALERARLREDA